MLNVAFKAENQRQVTQKFHGKVHRVKNVLYLTQAPFDYALVTKIQDGGTDIAVNSLEPVIPSETS